MPCVTFDSSFVTPEQGKKSDAWLVTLTKPELPNLRGIRMKIIEPKITRAVNHFRFRKARRRRPGPGVTAQKL